MFLYCWGVGIPSLLLFFSHFIEVLRIVSYIQHFNTTPTTKVPLSSTYVPKTSLSHCPHCGAQNCLIYIHDGGMPRHLQNICRITCQIILNRTFLLCRNSIYISALYRKLSSSVEGGAWASSSSCYLITSPTIWEETWLWKREGPVWRLNMNPASVKPLWAFSFDFLLAVRGRCCQ